jgi:hypothetical protein
MTGFFLTCLLLSLPPMPAPTEPPDLPKMFELSRFPSDARLNAWREDAAQAVDRGKVGRDEIRNLIRACEAISQARRGVWRMNLEHWTEEELLRLQRSARPVFDKKGVEQAVREELKLARNYAPEFFRTGKLPDPRAVIDDVRRKPAIVRQKP